MIASVELVLIVVDPGQPFAPIAELWRRLDLKSKNILGVFTKTDLHPRKDSESAPALQSPYLELLPQENWVETSAATRAGIPFRNLRHE